MDQEIRFSGHDPELLCGQINLQEARHDFDTPWGWSLGGLLHIEELHSGGSKSGSVSRAPSQCGCAGLYAQIGFI